MPEYYATNCYVYYKNQLILHGLRNEQINLWTQILWKNLTTTSPINNKYVWNLQLHINPKMMKFFWIFDWPENPKQMKFFWNFQCPKSRKNWIKGPHWSHVNATGCNKVLPSMSILPTDINIIHIQQQEALHWMTRTYCYHMPPNLTWTIKGHTKKPTQYMLSTTKLTKQKKHFI